VDRLGAGRLVATGCRATVVTGSSADLLGFLRRLPVAAVAALVVWALLRPALDGAVCGFAELLIRAYEYPKVTRLVAVDHVAEVRRADLRTDSAIPTVALTSIHFNTIVLLALFLALPRPWSSRQLQRLLMGWSLLYLSQALNLLFHVKFMYASGLGSWSAQHYSDIARNVFGYLQYFTDLPGRFAFPFAIWLGFNWDLVTELVGLPVPETLRGTRRSRRDRKRPR
jgi:hypothetical protein